MPSLSTGSMYGSQRNKEAISSRANRGSLARAPFLGVVSVLVRREHRRLVVFKVVQAYPKILTCHFPVVQALPTTRPCHFAVRLFYKQTSTFSWHPLSSYYWTTFLPSSSTLSRLVLLGLRNLPSSYCWTLTFCRHPGSSSYQILTFCNRPGSFYYLTLASSVFKARPTGEP